MNVVAEQSIDVRHQREALARSFCLCNGATLWPQEYATCFDCLRGWNQHAIYVTKAYAKWIEGFLKVL